MLCDTILCVHDPVTDENEPQTGSGTPVAPPCGFVNICHLPRVSGGGGRALPPSPGTSAGSDPSSPKSARLEGLGENGWLDLGCGVADAGGCLWPLTPHYVVCPKSQSRLCLSVFHLLENYTILPLNL